MDYAASEAEVWEWLSSKVYAKDLEKENWEYIDGKSLLQLDRAQLLDLGAPLKCIARMLSDIRCLSPVDGV